MGGGRQIAARENDLKVLHIRQNPAEFYDLAADIGESNDLANVRTNELTQIETDINGWNKQLIPPVFPGLAGHAAELKDPKRLVEP